MDGGDGCCSNKRSFEINFDKYLEHSDDDPPPEIVITKTVSGVHQSSEPVESIDGELLRLSDKELEDKIRRLTNSARLSSKLPDKGVKLNANLKAHEEESERRKRRKVAVECQTSDDTEGLGPGGASSEAKVGAHSVSLFANLLPQKLEADKDSHTRINDATRIYDAFDKEPQTMGPGDRRNRKQKVRHADKERYKSGISWKGRGNLSLASRERNFLNQNDLAKDRKIPKLKNAFQGRHLDKPVADKTVVLLDEEEPTVEVEITSVEEEESMRDITIYYPSRSDAECVEVQYKDLRCLNSGQYLTSPIMNFYIRFLQGTSTAADDAPHDYYFFNTYFYKKLQDAVSPKNNDKEASFNKLRRWWRGVNLFEKAYIFLPIHDDLHWSLGIVCIPDKEDKCGPIILHLDSLGFHNSRSIFENIKRFLREEWNILKEETSSPPIPFTDHIWQNLPRRIEEKIVKVPSQKNDSDCGPFVLYFIERIIEDAPQRLRKNDLDTFGKHWFKPAEASGLRSKIKTMLQNEFNKAKSMMEPVILPDHDSTSISGPIILPNHDSVSMSEPVILPDPDWSSTSGPVILLPYHDSVSMSVPVILPDNDSAEDSVEM